MTVASLGSVRSSIVATPAQAVSRGGIVLQRACSCGQHSHGEGECEECKKKRELQMHRDGSSASATALATTGPIGGVDWNFASVPARPARITVAPADDPLEREAERIADRVVGSDQPSAVSHTRRRAPGAERQLWRQAIDSASEVAEAPDEDADELLEEEEASDSGEEPELSPDETGRPKLEADASANGRTISVPIPDTGGAPLDAPVRAHMERRIGHDFGRVRVHTDHAAAKSARALHAHAYTVGSDVYFAHGQYAPASQSGQRLIAHELAHVVQQSGADRSVVQRQPAGAARRRRRGDAPRRERESRQGRRRARAGSCNCDKHPVSCATGECTACAPATSRSVRHPCCGNEVCATSGAANASNFIRHISVNLSTQMLTEHWGTASATTRILPPYVVSPRPGVTPTGMHRIGRKCGRCHTNQCGDGMGWFTSFANDLEFGFHNSQRVGGGVFSHGCVRVGAPGNCGPAQHIHDNTASGTTTVCIHTGNECGRRPPARPGGATPSEPPRRPAVSESQGGAGEPGESMPAAEEAVV
jgi:hypothetical protein